MTRCCLQPSTSDRSREPLPCASSLLLLAALPLSCRPLTELSLAAAAAAASASFICALELQCLSLVQQQQSREWEQQEKGEGEEGGATQHGARRGAAAARAHDSGRSRRCAESRESTLCSLCQLPPLASYLPAHSTPHLPLRDNVVTRLSRCATRGARYQCCSGCASSTRAKERTQSWRGCCSHRCCIDHTGVVHRTQSSYRQRGTRVQQQQQQQQRHRSCQRSELAALAAGIVQRSMRRHRLRRR